MVFAKLSRETSYPSISCAVALRGFPWVSQTLCYVLLLLTEAFGTRRDGHPGSDIPTEPDLLQVALQRGRALNHETTVLQVVTLYYD